jgi:hypothetical protein
VTYPFGEDPTGLGIYTDTGLFSGQVMRRGRPRLASGDQSQGTAEEFEAACTGVISYYGAYELDSENGFAVHHVEASLFPNWEGQP